MQTSDRTQSTVTITRRGADRIRAGHAWVYRSDVSEAKDILPGALVTVNEAGGRGPHSTAFRAGPPHTRMLGSAFYSTASEIAIRMISSKPIVDIEKLVRERIRAAIAYRELYVQNTNADRVIFSEGDSLPGLIVDRYNDILSLQVLTQAMDAEPIRRVFLSELQEALHPTTIFERVDPRVRKLEQLPEKESGVIWNASEFPTLAAKNAARMGNPQSEVRTEFQMNGVRFVYDAFGGQKTGAFLDQRENYAAAARYARGEALDVFCYQGGFALHLAPTCDKVTGVDSSRPALEVADQNAALNGREIEWIEANAFDLLRDYSDAGKRYDTIVLDPPAFAKSRQNRETALRGYK